MIPVMPADPAAPGAAAPPWTVGDIAALLAGAAAAPGDPGPAPAAIGAMHAALAVWSADQARYAEHLGYLADVHYMRFERTREAAELDQALAVWRLVRLDAPGISGLVAARLRIFGVQLEIASALRQEDRTGLAASMSAQCTALRGELRHLGSPSLLGDLARNAPRWAGTVIELGDWAAAADALDLGARAADELFRRLPLDERPRAVAEFRHLALDAASALARADRLDEGLVLLERARQRIVRFWRGRSDINRLLAARDPALFEQFLSQQEQWAGASRAHFDLDEPSDVSAAIEQADAAEQRLVATLGRIRAIPGLERYWMQPGLAEIKAAARPDPILYIWTSKYDTSIALVLPDGAVHGKIFPGLTGPTVGKLLKPWADCLNRASGTTLAERMATLATLGKILETYLVPGLCDLLTDSWNHPSGPECWRWGPVTLIVSGLLSYVPVHAWSPVIADDQSGAVTQVMPLYYAPSARQSQISRRVPRPTGASRRLLSLADPETGQPGLPALPCARLEAAAIAGRSPGSLLLHGPAATRAALLANLAGYEVVHLACHGTVSTSAPGGARLELADGPLDVNDLASISALDHVALVVLSACRSGQPDRFIPEEALDMGSLLLAAGARAVVANLWAVDDLAAALFVSRLFRLWDWGTGLALPDAVSSARLWLRDVTAGQLRALAQRDPRWAPQVRRYTGPSPADRKLFAEPYFWAAFACSGS